MDKEIRGLWKLPDGRYCLWRNLGLALLVRAMLSKSLIQFSIDGWGCVPSLYGLRPNYGGDNGVKRTYRVITPSKGFMPGLFIKYPDPMADHC